MVKYYNFDVDFVFFCIVIILNLIQKKTYFIYFISNFKSYQLQVLDLLKLYVSNIKFVLMPSYMKKVVVVFLQNNLSLTIHIHESDRWTPSMMQLSYQQKQGHTTTSRTIFSKQQ